MIGDAGLRPGSLMAEEMAEQPLVLSSFFERGPEIEAMLRELVPVPPRGILMLARGTSDNAATYGRYLLEAAIGVPVGLVAPSIWTRFSRRPDLHGQLLFALSQSGRTPEIQRVVELAGAAGAKTVAITNDESSPLAAAADGVIAIAAGAERAVPATKTFTGQVAALAMAAEALAPGRIEGLRELAAVAPLQQRLLEDRGRVGAIVPTLSEARAVVSIGSGYLYALALEAGLKLLETTSVPVLAYSASDFVHGPLAVAGPDVPLVCFAAAGSVHRDLVAAAGAAADRGAPIVWVSDFAARADASYQHLETPSGVPESLACLLHAIRAQQLALELSLALGRDPDTPFGLRKITPTS